VIPLHSRSAPGHRGLLARLMARLLPPCGRRPRAGEVISRGRRTGGPAHVTGTCRRAA